MEKYDVFISCKSEDYKEAGEVYQYLVDNGFVVFFADQVLSDIGKAEYGEAIDEALDQAEHLIVYTSKADYVKTGYVNTEWRNFTEEKRSGRKGGNIITVLDNVDIADLPLALRNVQSFTKNTYQPDLLGYIETKEYLKRKSEKLMKEVEPQSNEASFDVENSIVDYKSDINVIIAEQYELGSGVPQNYEIAYQQFEVAAKKKNPYAIYKLAKFQENGYGCEQDEKKALRSYKKAAELGYIAAYYDLGCMYADGIGVRPDEQAAFMWFEKSAAAGEPKAMNELGNYYLDGAFPVEQDYKQALEWYTKAATQKEPNAMCNLGLMYKNGFGVKQNHKKAFSWFKKSSAKGNLCALVELGICHENALGTEQNYELAAESYQQVLEKDPKDATALYHLGVLCFEGKGLEMDQKKAFSLITRAADLNSEEANMLLGKWYENGIVVGQNTERAIMYYEEAHNLGCPEAYSNIIRLSGITVDDTTIMIVEDVFSVSGRGVVVTGQLLCEKVSVGQEICLESQAKKVFSTIDGIIFSRMLVDEGHRGDNVGLLLNKDIKKKQLAIGMKIRFA